MLVGVIMVGLGTLSSLGYGPLAGVTVLGMQFLDFFDFLTNSVMMPIAAIATCLLVSRVVGVERIEHEVTLEGGSFRRKKVFNFMIRWLCRCSRRSFWPVPWPMRLGSLLCKTGDRLPVLYPTQHLAPPLLRGRFSFRARLSRAILRKKVSTSL